MSDSLARHALARAAARLNVRSRYAGQLPHLVLLTDDLRLPDPLSAARALPRGSMIIVRSRSRDTRRALAVSILKMARSRAFTVLIADDPELANACKADGIHLPESMARHAAHWRARRPGFIVTVAAHSMRAVCRAPMADAILLSSAFPTESHPDRSPLTPARMALLARHSRLPLYALGGIDARNAARIRGINFIGLAAISALAV
jgi:thiamine-phosphate pyrophosphorylase